ncbi:hypothetical protein [Pseudomonas sp. NPDC089734]|uniref:hypothetical protein n=1 Tax=Pseudomonas sp. NPDC089734 TaxID=3364469 RepID=UPI0038238686
MKNLELSQRLSKLSARDLQLYASKCLQTYCNAKLIRHESIDELIAHLVSHPESGNLGEWERNGALLALNGRGDEMPPDLAASIPVQDIEEFSYLVDCVVEVGIVDMYGAPTDLPLGFVDKAVSVLSKNNIELPAL